MTQNEDIQLLAEAACEYLKIPHRLREDAIQEAWIAFLSDKSIQDHLKGWYKKEEAFGRCGFIPLGAAKHLPDTHNSRIECRNYKQEQLVEHQRNKRAYEKEEIHRKLAKNSDTRLTDFGEYDKMMSYNSPDYNDSMEYE